MWHVDEGTLHAFLDERERGPAAGALDEETRARVAAHLAVCDVCANQLRAAERARARAAHILAAASPAIETPPFELVSGPLAAPRPVPARPRRAVPRQLLPLAWAASLMLAVGAGWMGSLLWRQGGAARSTAEPAPAASPPAARDVAVRNEARDAAAQEGGPAALSGTFAARGGEPSATRTPGQPERPRLAPAQSGVAAARADAAPERDRRLAAGLAATDTNRAERREPAAEQNVMLAQQPAEKRSAEVAGVARAEAKLSDAAAQPGAAVALQVGAAGGEKAAESGYPGDADVAWVSTSREQAERLLGATLYTLADAPILELAAAPDAQPALVRVRQAVDGRAVELLQWRQPADFMAQAPAAPRPTGLVPETRAARREIAAAAPPGLTSSQASDGGRFVRLAGTTHPVLLKVAPGADPLPLVGRVKPTR
jgi:hypothetical protein